MPNPVVLFEGRKISDPMDIPNGPSIAMFADPDGHVIGLVKGM